MKEMNRRNFLAATGALAAAQLATPNLVAASPNETVGIGFVGVGSRGTVLLVELKEILGGPMTAVGASSAPK